MACTIRIAADTARLGQPEINLGSFLVSAGRSAWRASSARGAWSCC